MQFDLNEEQRALQETVRSFFAEIAPTSLHHAQDQRTKDDALTLFRSRLSELGVRELFAPGGGGGFRELVILSKESARALLQENIEDELFAQSIAPGLHGVFIEGEVKLRPRIKTFFSGALTAPLVAKSGDVLVLSIAREEAVLLPLAESELKLKKCTALDITRDLHECSFQSACVKQWVGSQRTDELFARYQLLKVAHVLGAAERVVELSKEYVTTRKQFGVPVGGFQAVAHQLVNMYVVVEALGALVDYAAAGYSEGGVPSLRAVVSARIYATHTLATACERAIQIHGGVGFTWEYDLHLYLRRILATLALLDKISGKRYNPEQVLLAEVRSDRVI